MHRDLLLSFAFHFFRSLSIHFTVISLIIWNGLCCTFTFTLWTHIENPKYFTYTADYSDSKRFIASCTYGNGNAKVIYWNRRMKRRRKKKSMIAICSVMHGIGIEIGKILYKFSFVSFNTEKKYTKERNTPTSHDISLKFPISSFLFRCAAAWV